MVAITFALWAILVVFAHVGKRSFVRAIGLTTARRTAKRLFAGFAAPHAPRSRGKRPNPVHRALMVTQKRVARARSVAHREWLASQKLAGQLPVNLKESVAAPQVDIVATTPSWEEVVATLPVRENVKLRGKHRRLDVSGYANTRAQADGRKAKRGEKSLPLYIQRAIERREAFKKDKEVKAKARAVAQAKAEARRTALAKRVAARKTMSEARRVASENIHAFVMSKAWENRYMRDCYALMAIDAKKEREHVAFYGEIEDELVLKEAS